MLIKYDLAPNGTGHVFERHRLIVSESSPFQRIEISDIEILGRVLVLDNVIQLSELDCDRYHETFAHIPMSNLPKARRALILGGGDGILAKELLKYAGLIVDLVDIDERVCTLSKEHLSDMNAGAFDSPRLKLHFQDAVRFCRATPHKYDVIFADITDPHPDSPSHSLLSGDAIGLYKSLLTETGVLLAQTDNVQIAPEHYQKIAAAFNKHFSLVGDFAIVALTLSSLFSFVWASEQTTLRPAPISVPTSWLTLERSRFCFELLRLAL